MPCAKNVPTFFSVNPITAKPRENVDYTMSAEAA